MRKVMTRRQMLSAASAMVVGAAVPMGARAAPAASVVATTGMIADAAARIGGPALDVRGLMGPGVDPHAYRQTRTDIVALTRADLVLAHGLFLEAQMEAFLATLSRRVPVMSVAEELPTAELLNHTDYADKFDPHIWMDASLWARIVAPLAERIAQMVPLAADSVRANAAAYRADIQKLDAYVHSVSASVPDSARVLVTAHDAFGYFGRAYGFEVMGIQGISTESEAGLVRIRELVDVLVERKISAVFVESSVSDRNIRALIEGAASQGHRVSVGGELYSDAMGEPGTYEGTYLGMIDHNATTIARALGGAAPERGMAGLLSHGA